MQSFDPLSRIIHSHKYEGWLGTIRFSTTGFFIIKKTQSFKVQQNLILFDFIANKLRLEDIGPNVHQWWCWVLEYNHAYICKN